jgi:hypothetical protein
MIDLYTDASGSRNLQHRPGHGSSPVSIHGRRHTPGTILSQTRKSEETTRPQTSSPAYTLANSKGKQRAHMPSDSSDDNQYNQERDEDVDNDNSENDSEELHTQHKTRKSQAPNQMSKPAPRSSQNLPGRGRLSITGREGTVRSENAKVCLEPPL